MLKTDLLVQKLTLLTWIVNFSVATKIYETSPLNVIMDPTDESDEGTKMNFTCRARTDALIQEDLHIQWWHDVSYTCLFCLILY